MSLNERESWVRLIMRVSQEEFSKFLKETGVDDHNIPNIKH